MRTKDDVLSLINIGDGAAVEMFDVELRRVLRNIMDPNTNPKEPRDIIIKVRFLPDEDRDLAAVDVSVSSKVSGSKSFMTKVVFGRDSRGRVEAREFETGQQSFLKNGNVVPMHQEGEE